jgi:beta-lactamase regulating signal transducer with metallopeptidase domain
MVWLLVQHVAVCAVLAILVAVACRIGRLRPAVAHLLWLVVLVRLLVPPVLTWPWSPPDFASEIGPAAQFADGPARSFRDLWEGVTVTPAVPVASGDDGASVQRRAATSPWIVVGRIALAAWILGAVTLAGIQIVRLFRFNRCLREQRQSPDWIESEATSLAQRFGLRSPRVRVVNGIASPLFYGLRRPSILIPATLIDAIPRDQWPGVLAHELAHWKRRDHWVRSLELAAGCLWWWNPVFWLVRHHLRQTAELACDAWVVWALPEGRKAYAKTLVDISEMIALGNQPAAALGIGHGSRRSFEWRLSMVMRVKGRANVPVIGLLCAVLVLAVSVPLFADAKPRNETATATLAARTQLAATPSPSAGVSEKLQNALNSPVHIEFRNEHISRILEFISEYVGADIVIDYRVVQPPLAFDPRVPPEDRPEDTRVPQELGYVTDGMVPYVKMEEVLLGEAIDELCAPLGLTYVARPQYIWISTEDTIAKTDFSDPSAEADPDIAQRLEKLIALEFDDEHIARILEFVGQYTKVNFVLDKDAVPPPEPITEREPQRLPQPVNPPSLHKKLTPDGPQLTGVVPYIKLKRVTLDEALKAILLPLDLTYRVEPGRVYVTAPEKTF